MTNREITFMYLFFIILSSFVGCISKTSGLIFAILSAAYMICITFNSHDLDFDDDDDTDDDSDD